MIGFTAGFSSRVEAAVESKAFGSPRRTAWRRRCCHTGTTPAEACWRVELLGRRRAEALRR
eukprot:2871993-Pleurochrysis_carterae.AAC.1